jgi:hypothetical protein
VPPEETSAAAAWSARLAASLNAVLGIDGGLLTPRLQAGVLDLARDVAHGSERKNAPVAAFVAGRYVQARMAQGADAETALNEVRQAAAGLLTPDPGATP